MAETEYRIKYSYHFDSFLLYHIQDVTGRSSAEILNFFYELAGQVAQIGFQKTGKHNGIDKQIDDYFPGTSVPFFMRVKGKGRYYNSPTRWNETLRIYENVPEDEQEKFDKSASVYVQFPERATYVDSKMLDDAATAIMEKALLGGEFVEMSAFERPETSSPRMFKALMDEFAGRPKQEKKRRTKKDKQDGPTTEAT